MKEIITDMNEIVYEFSHDEFIRKFRKNDEKNISIICDMCNGDMNDTPNIYYYGDLKESYLSIEEINNDTIMNSGGYSICEECFKKVFRYGFMKTHRELIKPLLKKMGLQMEVVNENTIKLKRCDKK